MLSGSVFLCTSYLHHMHLVCASVCWMHHIMIPASSNHFSCTLHRVVPLTHCLFRKRLSLLAYTILNLTNPAVRANQIQIHCFLLSWWNFSQTIKLFKHPGSHRHPVIKSFSIQTSRFAQASSNQSPPVVGDCAIRDNLPPLWYVVRSHTTTTNRLLYCAQPSMVILSMSCMHLAPCAAQPYFSTGLWPRKFWLAPLSLRSHLS